MATDIARAIPGLWGYAGVDLLKCEEGVKVLEINPCLTTSYTALSGKTAFNPAQLLSRDEPGYDVPLVGAGAGRFLVARLAERFDLQYVDFNSFFETSGTREGLGAAECAPAVSVAALLQYRLTNATARVSGLFP